MTLADLESALARRPHSPLFARLAAEYLALGRNGEARRLCESGVVRYPAYASGRIVLGQCYAAEMQLEMALEELQTAAGLAPLSIRVEDLRSRWMEPPAQRPAAGPTGSGDDPDFTAAVTGIASGPIEPELMPEPDAEIGTAMPAVEVGEADETEAPVAGAPGAHPPALDRSPLQTSQDRGVPARQAADSLDDETGRIVTKTLAEIYATQNAYHEAITTYELLKRKRPEELAEIDQRIRELEAKRQSRTGIVTGEPAAPWEADLPPDGPAPGR